MEQMNLYLTTLEFKNLKEIGHGTDGSVYLYKNKFLIKLYHKRIYEIMKATKRNNEDIKIYTKGKIQYNDYYANDLAYYSYEEENNIKLHPKEGIKKAIERNNFINLTSLPIGIVYLNGRFAGCIIKRHYGIQIHKLTGLPINMRKRIYLNVLESIKELLKNNVYPIDLANSPFVKKQIILPNQRIITTGHSHILVNPITIKTQLIDLEGKSTIYTEKMNLQFYQQCLDNLKILTLEFLLQIDYEEHKEYIEEIDADLTKKNIPLKLREKLVYQEMNQLEDFYELTRVLKK